MGQYERHVFYIDQQDLNTLSRHRKCHRRGYMLGQLDQMLSLHFRLHVQARVPNKITITVRSDKIISQVTKDLGSLG